MGIDPGDLAANMDAGHVARSPWSSWDPVPEVIDDILLSRKIKRDDLESKRSKAILHKIHGAEDICTVFTTRSSLVLTLLMRRWTVPCGGRTATHRPFK